MSSLGPLHAPTRPVEAPTLARVAERIAALPAALDAAVRVPIPSPREPGPRRIVTTGIGASEGPARLLAAALVEDASLAARFVPLSAFRVAPPEGDLLVVFSQGLSPNALLAFGSPSRFRARWLVTSVSAAPGTSTREAVFRDLVADGVVPIVIPPATEEGLLVRVIGPVVASLVAMRIAAALGARSLAAVPYEEASRAYAAPCAIGPVDPNALALVTAGTSAEWAHAHRWKMLESLLDGDPPVWDVLSVAHGPLQSFHERSMCLLALATPRGAPLLDRLAEALSPGRHRLVRVVATRHDALAWLEHAAAIDACVLATLRAAPRDLVDWPGRGRDAPLYGIGERG